MWSFCRVDCVDILCRLRRRRQRAGDYERRPATDAPNWPHCAGHAAPRQMPGCSGGARARSVATAVRRWVRRADAGQLWPIHLMPIGKERGDRPAFRDHRRSSASCLRRVRRVSGSVDRCDALTPRRGVEQCEPHQPLCHESALSGKLGSGCYIFMSALRYDSLRDLLYHSRILQTRRTMFIIRTQCGRQ